MHALRKVLVVEDEPTIRRLFSLVMRGQPLQVEEAANGDDALSRVSGQRFDLILLDVALPHYSGFDVLKNLREKSPNRQTPVIVVTALSHERDLAQGYALGATRYITKPFEPAELLAQVRQLLGLEQPPADRFVLESREGDGDGVLHLRLGGAVDITNCDEASSRFGEVVDCGRHKKVILDASGLSFMDSSGLAAIMREDRRLAEAGGALHVVGAPKRIRKVFEFLGLSRLLV